MSLHVTAGRAGFKVAGIEPWRKAIKIETKNNALKGRANEEIIRELGLILKQKPEIDSGEKSREKKVFIPAISCEQALRMLGIR